MGHECGGKIARWTTPTIRYKPRSVNMSEISELYLVIKQKGAVIVQKGLEDASVSEDGYTWLLTQDETGQLEENLLATVQVDGKTEEGVRYTTCEKSFVISGSAINEVF